MGCASAKVKVVKPSSTDSLNQSISMTFMNVNSLSMKDIKGFRKSDHIDEYYDILEVIGRGKCSTTISVETFS